MPTIAALERRVAELEEQLSSLRSDSNAGEGAMMKALLDAIDARRTAENSLQSANEWLHVAQVAGGVAAYSFDLVSKTNEWSPASYVMYGFKPDRPVTFEDWLGSIHPDDLPAVQTVVQQTLERGSDVDHVFRIVRPDGQVRTILDRARVVMDGAGVPARLIGINVDITERRRLEDELRFNNQFLHSVLAASTDCVKVLTLDGQITFMNNGGLSIMEIADFAEVSGADWPSFWPEPGRAVALDALARARQGETVRFEGSCPTMSGTIKQWDVTVTPIVSDAGVARIVAVSRDISREHAAREQQALITRELHHRIKNSLATMQAIARSTARHARDLADFEPIFVSRLQSLARIHSALGTGADQASVATILADQVEPFGSGKMIELNGPEILLGHSRAIALSMIVHELVTNACKYGGLSDGGLGIIAHWSVGSGPKAEIRLEWSERGRANGPEAPPVKGSGFGSQLMRRLVASSLGGAMETDHTPEGYKVVMTWPHA